jgi:hypothetical protein
VCPLARVLEAGLTRLLAVYLLGPNAPGKHDSHDSHEDHKDHGRGLYRGPSREPKWTAEDEERERLAQQAEEGGDEDEAEESSEAESESEDEPATPSDTADEGDSSDDDDGEKKQRPSQAGAQKAETNRTPRHADPDKLKFAQEHQQRTAASKGNVDPKAMIVRALSCSLDGA